MTHHGLTDLEWEKLRNLLQRDPTDLEMQLFAALWSEHCSYKTSKQHLKRFPTEGDQVLQGPGEGAGIVQLDADTACVFKMESHNHPSAVEPVQGAATGVGGIIRDVISMGARPVALMDCLCFGPLQSDDPQQDQRQKYLLENVVKGISSYGNCIGVPTVGGDLVFDPGYSNNPLVNVMAVGLCSPKDIIPSKALEGVLVLYGSHTGREGLGGAYFASQDLDQEKQKEDRSSVQIGDPFMEKNLIEATMEIVRWGKGLWLYGLQDLGAAGLGCALTEMVYNGGATAHVNLSGVTLREEGLSARDLLLSETQERMLMCVRANSIDQWATILDKYNIPYSVIGKVGGKFVGYPEPMLFLDHKKERVLEVPISIFGEVPECEIKEMVPGNTPPSKISILMDTYELSKYRWGDPKWVYDQYDHMVGTQTLIGPGEASAAVLHPHGKNWGLAMTTSGLPGEPVRDYHEWAEMMIAKCTRDLISVGAKPLAITNCLNFANPKDPKVLHDFRSVIEGMTGACRVFNTPVTGGNVSLYNQTGDKGIPPTPFVGMIGKIDDINNVCRPGFHQEDLEIYLLGVEGCYIPEEGSLEKLHRVNMVVLDLIQQGWVHACQSVSKGGVIRALLKSAYRGSVGFKTWNCRFPNAHHRFLITIDPKHRDFVFRLLKRANIYHDLIGVTKKHECLWGMKHMYLSDVKKHMGNSLAQMLA